MKKMKKIEENLKKKRFFKILGRKNRRIKFDNSVRVFCLKGIMGVRVFAS